MNKASEPPAGADGLLPIRITELADLSTTEMAALRGLADRFATHARHAIIRQEGEMPPGLFFLLEGWAVSSVTLADGSRQLLKLHVPGDLMGAPSLPLSRAAETLIALTDVSVAQVSLEALGEIFVQHPRLGALFFLSAQEERVLLMDRLTGMGRLDARHRIAWLFVHLHERLRLVASGMGAAFDLPLTQEQLGDLLGLTAVHVNRTLRSLDAEGYLKRERGHIEILRYDDLKRLAALPPRTVRRNLSWLPPSRPSRPGR
ncbi:Crp/Fnr family transcriptional regulator [Flavisphingomonas formosensis]|uniref:Crp/Fnr family transcriptional regulator n=1 Tax=Flavisphingomonas formosensis TaxID=861534 RepID=UPI0012F763F8|nr:Crp/Fnr family transcriptional regulator [Sphingomonas formosensis]